jgi:hypothetical protein
MNVRSGASSPEMANERPSLCFRQPIPEIHNAAQDLDDAVTAHLAGNFVKAEQHIRLADKPEIHDWVESILGKSSPYVVIQSAPGLETVVIRGRARMPTAIGKRELHQRDGYHCRFCAMPVIRAEVRNSMRKFYPSALRWGKRNSERHSAFFAMWVQYDHLIPHARGGSNAIDNLLVTCAACNYGRGGYTLSEVGLVNPFDRPVTESKWDGLERFKQHTSNAPRMQKLHRVDS